MCPEMPHKVFYKGNSCCWVDLGGSSGDARRTLSGCFLGGFGCGLGDDLGSNLRNTLGCNLGANLGDIEVVLGESQRDLLPKNCSKKCTQESLRCCFRTSTPLSKFQNKLGEKMKISGPKS